MWRSYFGHGTHLVGIDIDPRCAGLARHRIDVRIGDQSDREFLRKVVAEDGMFIEYIKPLVDDLNAFNSRPEDLKPTISPGPAPASRRDTS